MKKFFRAIRELQLLPTTTKSHTSKLKLSFTEKYNKGQNISYALLLLLSVSIITYPSYLRSYFWLLLSNLEWKYNKQTYRNPTDPFKLSADLFKHTIHLRNLLEYRKKSE